MTDLRQTGAKPLRFVDIDGVLSLFGFALDDVPAYGRWHQVDGILHFLSERAARHLQDLADVYDHVWCSGWEDRANDHLPHVLGLGPYPHLVFGESPGHWKLAAVRAYARERACAWIDDDVNDAVRGWARSRSQPTLVVETEPATGLTSELADRLRAWGESVAPRP